MIFIEQKIAYVLRFTRRQKGLNQIEMADFLGIPPRTYQRLEYGSVDIKLNLLHQISQKLQIPLVHLISPSVELENIFMSFSIPSEFSKYTDASKIAAKNDNDLKWGESLLLLEKNERANCSKKYSSKVDGLTCYFSPEFAKEYGVPEGMQEFQQYLIAYSAVEIWEALFRRKATSAIIQSVVNLPVGIRAFEEHHLNINASPENPYSECVLWDITAQKEIEAWVKHLSIMRGKGRYF